MTLPTAVRDIRRHVLQAVQHRAALTRTHISSPHRPTSQCCLTDVIVGVVRQRRICAVPFLVRSVTVLI
jgi:hypothetical protein